MDEQQPVLVRMGGLLDRWEAAQDRRLIFLTCYRMMTQNILTAIETKEFEDPAWVATLMENFANYYFRALETYESDPSQPPAAWRIAFKAAGSPHIHAMQNLVLGVNAHINYDLVFALSELLAPGMAAPERRSTPTALPRSLQGQRSHQPDHRCGSRPGHRPLRAGLGHGG